MSPRRTHLWAGAAVAVTAGIAWGSFEAGWVRMRSRDVRIPALPPELDGLRIVHLSDFHLGLPGRGRRAVDQAIEWAASRDPDLTVLTGDLVSHPRGERALRELVPRLPRCYAILGNHDFAISRDPFAARSAIRDLAPATLLSDSCVRLEVRGKRVYIAGSDPRARFNRRRLQAEQLARPRRDADLRILLLHYPREVGRLRDDAFDLILAGHMHGGQICLPYPGGKVLLAHPRSEYRSGLYRTHAGVLHVSPGLGTTFVPLRFFARPEATELVLRAA